MITVENIVDSIKNFHIANMTLGKWKLNYDRVKKEFWQTLGAIVVVVLLLFVFCGGDSDTETTAQDVVQTTAQPDDFIEQACKEYETETGRKIYPKGREFIRNGAVKQGLRTVDDVYILIVQNAKYMWKDSIKINKNKQ